MQQKQVTLTELLERVGLKENDGERRPLMRPKLQDTRTRILVSRDEQVKTLQRIRRAEAYRRDRLERSIRAKDQLADEIKATRERNSKAVVLSRLRWKREREAIREKPEVWASLHTAAGSSSSSSSSSSWGSSRPPIGCLNTAFSDENKDEGSLASSLTPQDTLSRASLSASRQGRGEPQHDPLQRRGQPRSHPGPDNQAPASPKRVSQHPLSLERSCNASPHRVDEPRRENLGQVSPAEGPTGTLPVTTAPSSLLNGSVTDAETGETLELRRRRWEFPQPCRRAGTAGPRGGGGDDNSGGDYDDPRSWRGSTTDLAEEGSRQSLWPGKGQGERCRQAHFSGDVVQDREDVPQTTKRCGAGARENGGDDDARQTSQQAPDDAGERGQRAEHRTFERARSDQRTGMHGGGEMLVASDSDNHNGDSGESGGRNHSNTATDSVQNVDRISSQEYSSPGVVPGKKRACPVGGGDVSTGDARSGGTQGLTVAPAPGLQRRPQCRCEPLTPRSTKRVLSPFWIPPLQDPPSSIITGPSRVAEGRSPAATGGQLGTGSDGDRRSENSVGIEGGGTLASQVLVDDGGDGGGWSGAEKGVAPAELSATLGEAADERVRQNMLYAQEIRDRYLSQVQQMIMDERAEEKRRVSALRAAAGHPLRCRRLQLRHDQEREEKRTLISWIRRDIELIVVQKMAALGLIR